MSIRAPAPQIFSRYVEWSACILIKRFTFGLQLACHHDFLLSFVPTQGSRFVSPRWLLRSCSISLYVMSFICFNVSFPPSTITRTAKFLLPSVTALYVLEIWIFIPVIVPAHVWNDCVWYCIVFPESLSTLLFPLWVTFDFYIIELQRQSNIQDSQNEKDNIYRFLCLYCRSWVCKNHLVIALLLTQLPITHDVTIRLACLEE